MAMNSLIYLAMFAKDRGKQERAAHLLGCAFAWGESFGHHPTPNVWATIKPDVDDLRAALGEDAYAKASAEGRAMKWEDAVDLALRIAD